MTDKEKLIDLLDTHCDYAGHVDCKEDCTACLADHLLSHGVTFEKQGEWIWDVETHGNGARMKGAVNNE